MLIIKKTLFGFGGEWTYVDNLKFFFLTLTSEKH